jgi:hypothetical protein
MTIEAQWVDLRERLHALDKGGLSSFIALSDVSGSMRGTPMEVSIAMGILISELAGPAFKDQFITFHEVPTWHSLKDCTTLFDKVQSARSASWGGSTDFLQAMKLVLKQCKDFDMDAGDVAQLKLAVFSDMQFDESLGHESQGTWASKAAAIASMWKAAGFLLPSGEAAVPRIVFWNLRGDTLDFPATADTPGVDLVSGYSAMGLKMFMEEGDLTSAPYEGYRKVLDDSRYDAVRDACASSAELAKVMSVGASAPSVGAAARLQSSFDAVRNAKEDYEEGQVILASMQKEIALQQQEIALQQQKTDDARKEWQRLFNEHMADLDSFNPTLQSSEDASASEGN